MLNSLNFLRFVFAIFIFAHHKNISQNIFLDALGPCGVSFFIILSGFVMGMGYFEKCTTPGFNYKKFCLKRIIRLYPLHVLCLLGFLILNIRGEIYLGRIICNIFLIQSWFPIKEIYFSGNAVSWCLSDLMFFYLIFPLVVRKLVNFKFSIFLFSLYILSLFFIPDNYVHAFIYINPIYRFVDFFIGILLYKLYLIFENKRISFWKMYLVCIIALFCSIFLYGKVPERLGFQSLFWIPSCFIIFTFALAEKKGRIKIDNSGLKKLGSISFYMIHQLGIGVLEYLFNKLNFGNYMTRFCLELLLIGFTSFIVNKFYEIPIKNLFLKKIEKKAENNKEEI